MWFLRDSWSFCNWKRRRKKVSKRFGPVRSGTHRFTDTARVTRESEWRGLKFRRRRHRGRRRGRVQRRLDYHQLDESRRQHSPATDRQQDRLVLKLSRTDNLNIVRCTFVALHAAAITRFTARSNAKTSFHYIYARQVRFHAMQFGYAKWIGVIYAMFCNRNQSYSAREDWKCNYGKHKY